MGLACTIDWQSMGAEVVGTAADGVEALNIIMSRQPDVVLTDIRMPRMDGLQLATKLRKSYPSIKVVFLTSYAEFEYAQQAVRLGVDDYLLKPIEESALAQLMAHLKEQLSQPAAHGTVNTQPKLPQINLVEWMEVLQYDELNIYVRRTLERIQSAYTERLSAEEIANELEVSPSYLSRKLKEATGHTFGGLLARYRLQEAIKLLNDGRYKVYEVAEHTGFGEYKSFCQTFKRYLHASPKKYMQERELKLGE